MLLDESHVDVATKEGGNMRIFIFHPKIDGYPHAKFPGVVVFSEIYQVTGPVARLARQLAGSGYIAAAPSSYHEFTGPEPLPYDNVGTDQGNAWKAAKKLEAYDEDARLAVDHLLTLPTCSGRVGAVGMCLGGHLAFRAAFDRRVVAAVCYFATDIHSRSLGTVTAEEDNTTLTLAARPGALAHAELVLIFGKRDTHVPRAGRDSIRSALEDAGVLFSMYEVAAAQHAFIRDELSKGRYDPGVAGVCWGMMMECFGRCLRADLGPREGRSRELEHVC